MQDYYYENWDGHLSGTFQDVQASSGVRVYIYNRDEKMPKFERQIHVSPGTQADIALRRGFQNVGTLKITQHEN